MSREQMFDAGIASGNTCAIEYLQRGDGLSAIGLFRQCLQSLNRHIRTQAARGRVSHPNSVVQTVPIARDGMEALTDPVISDQLFTMFSGAFEMSFQASDNNENCAKILLFNMALACEIQAHWCETHHDAVAALAWSKRAVSIYKSVIRVGHGHPNDTFAEAVDLAAINNLGRLYSCLHCAQDARDALLMFIQVFRRLRARRDCPEAFLSKLEGLAPFGFLGSYIMTNAPVA